MVYPFHRWIDGDLDSRSRPEVRPGPTGLRACAGRGRGGDHGPGSGRSIWRPDPDEEDVAALARRCSARISGSPTNAPIPGSSFVPGFPDSSVLRAKVAERGGVGFLLHPVTVEAVMAVSDRGGVMPPKATFFAPKPRSGLFLVKR